MTNQYQIKNNQNLNHNILVAIAFPNSKTFRKNIEFRGESIFVEMFKLIVDIIDVIFFIK